jgi:hypothetical protein
MTLLSGDHLYRHIQQFITAFGPYVEEYGGLIYFTRYRPDPESLQLAAEAAAQRPEVSGRKVVLFDEVATRRRRGFRGITLVGIDADGYPANWHQRSDTIAAIDPDALEQAARFAWQMIQQLDQRAG